MQQERINNRFSLSGKVILVTGASSGIGQDIAISCSQMGAKVIITARDITRLEQTRKQLVGEGHMCFSADLTKSEDRERLVEQLPNIDGLVQCAGVMLRVPCKMISGEDIAAVFDVNVNAPILLQSDLLINKKINVSSSIVYISSMAAHSATAGNALYSASKAALLSYADCLALELAPRKIRVNSICPAMVATNMAHEGVSQSEIENDLKNYPLKRYGTTQDISNLAIYLLSNASAWMTGSHLDITGGTK